MKLILATHIARIDRAHRLRVIPLRFMDAALALTFDPESPTHDTPYPHAAATIGGLLVRSSAESPDEEDVANSNERLARSA